jgi:uncharacterized protein YbaP (TraB family)
MKRRTRTLASLVLAGLAAASQLLAQQAHAASAAPAKKAMFWKVSSRDHVAWLLGSIHVGSKSMYPLPKEIEDAFDRSEALLVEIDINHVDLSKMQGLILTTGMYAGDDTLWKHVSPETRQRLEEFCEKYSFPAMALAKMKPWAVAAMVATLPLMKTGMDMGLGIDKYFLDKADKVKKRVVEIESAEGQMKLISGITAEMLENAVATQAKQDPQESGKRLQEVWIAGDTIQMEKITREMTASDPADFSAAMLRDRNLHMADVAEQFLKGKETAFVVVGAAHMVGADGVVKLLETRGYKVEQVALAPEPAR